MNQANLSSAAKQVTATPFTPPLILANPHIQTMCSSVGRRFVLPKREAAFLSHAEKRVLDLDQARLLVHLNLRQDAPLVMIIPGWLGCYASSYVISVAKQLWTAGYSVARLNLRDHGYTAHLNEQLFHSGMIDEVVAMVDHLHQQHGQGASGLVGYSLGGNFALRVARELPELATLAVCPALSPASTLQRIDSNFIYQRYFVRKWRTMLSEKQTAFPHLFDFGEAMRLSTVGALTDYFVRHLSPFDHTAEYFNTYDLTGDALKGVRARVLAAEDDPVIPPQQYRSLEQHKGIELDMTPKGGHGAYLQNWQFESWADAYTQRFFDQQLRSA